LTATSREARSVGIADRHRTDNFRPTAAKNLLPGEFRQRQETDKPPPNDSAMARKVVTREGVGHLLGILRVRARSSASFAEQTLGSAM
jgi:hypothetical protein